MEPVKVIELDDAARRRIQIEKRLRILEKGMNSIRSTLATLDEIVDDLRKML